MGYWDFLNAMADVGAISGKAAGASANARKAENDQLNERDRTTSSNYATQQRAVTDAAQLAEKATTDAADIDLARKKFDLAAPATRAKNAAVGSLLANVKDVSFDRPSGVPGGGYSGGLRPSALSSAARQAGQELENQSIRALMAGDTYTALPTAGTGTAGSSGSVLAQPTLSSQKGASALEKLLSGLGLAGSLAGAATPNRYTSLQGGADGQNSPGSSGGLGSLFKSIFGGSVRGTGTPYGQGAVPGFTFSDDGSVVYNGEEPDYSGVGWDTVDANGDDWSIVDPNAYAAPYDMRQDFGQGGQGGQGNPLADPWKDAQGDDWSLIDPSAFDPMIYLY